MSAESTISRTGLEIAIIGMAGRFPGADDVEAFWRNIRDGVESVRQFDDDQLRALGVPDQVLADPGYVKAAVPFEGAERFDAALFGYTPRDAEQIDPQQRIFLECAWHALENAGYNPLRCPGSVGVYAGTGASLYLIRHLLPQYRLGAETRIADLLGLVSGNMPDALVTRVAYKLNLRGPAVNVQTACSTSLVAVHMACQALLGLECDMALAGGVSLNLLQQGGYHYQAGAIFSPDGHCRAFDARAAGTLQGSGAGIVVLKRLDEALRDGDCIRAVIRGSAANNDGSNKVSFTAPSIEGQAAVIQAAQAMAGTPPDTIGYIEAHGTGTTLGDPIEIAALKQAFGNDNSRRNHCALGSVKTNVGHLDSAAGVAGLIKAVKALEYRTLPPSLHFEKPNPEAGLPESPFYVNTQAHDWEAGATLRRAGVSSFGIGGTNVHVVLEEFVDEPACTSAQALPPARESVADAGWQILPLSGRTLNAVSQMAKELAAALDADPALDTAGVAATLQDGREPFPFRLAVVAKDLAQAAEALHQEAERPVSDLQAAAGQPEVAFLFPGGGVQHVQMGRSLYEHEPVFRGELDRCFDWLRANNGLDLAEIFFPSPENEPEADRTLFRMDVAQPALFAVSYAMARLWMSRGVVPTLMLGHSLGEYTAATLAGVFQLEDALKIVAARGRLLHSLPPGAMTAVPMSAAALQPWLQQGCDLAAINGEQLCVLSGPIDVISEAERQLEARGMTPRRLHVAVASHSAMTEPILAELERVVASVPRQAPKLAFISTVTGRPVTAEQAESPAYWASHLRATVRFADGLGILLGKDERVLVEVGPGDALTGLARQHPASGRARGIWPSQAHPLQRAHNSRRYAQTTAALWCAGVALDWRACRSGSPGRQDRHRKVPLPGYAFQRQAYWVDGVDAATGTDGDRSSTSRAMQPQSGPFYKATWSRTPTPARLADEQAGSVYRNRSLILFGHEARLSRALIAASQARGAATLVRVEPGTAFRQMCDDHFVIRPDEREDHARLLREIAARYEVAGICHAWNVDGRCRAPGEPGAAMGVGFFPLLALAQALARIPEIVARPAGGDGKRLRLLVLAEGAEDVSGQEALQVEKAALQPLCKVIGQEMPEIHCQFIDVCDPATERTAADLARQILDESEVAQPTDTALALRGDIRWLKAYESFALQAPPRSRFRKGGIYLLTGGLGGVGLALAEHLARHWQARLVLVGRTAMPPASDWQPLLASAETQKGLHERLRHLLALQELGAAVMTAAVDVADATQMSALLEQAKARFGIVHGVIHGAGHAEEKLIDDISRDSAERVFAAKVDGTRILLDVFRDEPLDFMLMCSSISSMTGGLGKADYAAANACLDAATTLAARELPFPVMTVNWDAWRNLGMAAGLDIPEGIGWDGAEGAQVFERIVNAGAPAQVVISTTDLALRLGPIDNGMLEVIAAQAQVGKPRRRHARPALATPFAAPAGEVQEMLASIWSDLLGIDRIGADDNLFELGGDSLLAIQILARVRQAYAVELHPAGFFKRPTIADLAILVEDKLLQEVESEASE